MLVLWIRSSILVPPPSTSQNFKLNVMVDILVLRVLEMDGSGGRLMGNNGNEATFGGKGGPVILKRGEMKVEDF